MNEFQNSDGTYNGVKVLAQLTGLSESEIAWTASRLQQLIRDEGKSKNDAVAIVKSEAKGKPWLQL